MPPSGHGCGSLLCPVGLCVCLSLCQDLPVAITRFVVSLEIRTCECSSSGLWAFCAP